MHPYLTLKQIELMRVITEQNETDLDEILSLIRYHTSKQSLQFSIRALIGRGLVEKRGIIKVRGRMRQVIAPTAVGAGYKSLPEARSGARKAAIVELGATEELTPIPEDILGM